MTQPLDSRDIGSILDNQVQHDTNSLFKVMML